MGRMRSSCLAAAAALILGASGGGIAIGGADVATALEAALLEASDLPEGMLSLGGITHQPAFDYDEASFDAAGGLAAVAQTWQAATVTPDAPVVIAFDFRFLFPDEAAAAAYLDAAEAVLSEASTGIELQAATPLLGDDLRHYAGQLSQGGVTIDAHNLLLRSGPVVAKVYLGGFGTGQDDALPIGQAAVERIAAFLAATPAPSATPTDAPVSPGDSPSTSPAATAPAPASPAPAGTLLRQWAVSATASSEYGGGGGWSAMDATGEPDVPAYSDDGHAWAPSGSEVGIQWLELTYAQAVVPAEVTIVESHGNGAVTLVEALDPASGEWVELWSGSDPSPQELVSFSPRLAPVAFATTQLRVTLDTDLVEGWNEIDPVELAGSVP